MAFFYKGYVAMRQTTNWPNVTPVEVASALSHVVGMLDEGADTDVRLQVYEDGQWIVRWGSSDYDQDHRGYWGAGSVHHGMDPYFLNNIAASLLEQVAEAVALNSCREE